jgi:hypothetical protein
MRDGRLGAGCAVGDFDGRPDERLEFDRIAGDSRVEGYEAGLDATGIVRSSDASGSVPVMLAFAIPRDVATVTFACPTAVTTPPRGPRCRFRSRPST